MDISRTLFIAGLSLLVAGASCTSFKKALDRFGVNDIAEEMTNRGAPGNPEVFRALIASHDLARDTAPMGGDVRDEDRP
ncbi:MAG: hypothetical protein A2289_25955 [Deltaproteobacteria bacterium RIFOXYA12_FULL_58_15]|nr:MAG: hypothetical protein A2289_25955 [Deltaproteobacteria bacterium RIFOXYA12_FULL_58_15]OGR11648.1 MAG: hypothetical protein A2341_02740 [Deltaproteobacteria bacterium RIFOXYB12_FULL_58_9]